MELVISPAGIVRCIYGEDLDLHALGSPQIQRASAVEPDEFGQWWADLSPVSGPRLGPFIRRGEAVGAEVNWLASHWLIKRNILYERSLHEGFDCPDRDLDCVGTDRLPGSALCNWPPGHGSAKARSLE